MRRPQGVPVRPPISCERIFRAYMKLGKYLVRERKSQPDLDKLAEKAEKSVRAFLIDPL
jgi:hypothetical protein